MPARRGTRQAGTRMKLVDGKRLHLLQRCEGCTNGALPALLILNSITDQKLETHCKPDVTVPQAGRLLIRQDDVGKPLAST